MSEKIVGIIGGMGPEATIDLMQRLLRLTPAADDLDPIHTMVDNDPKIPSRIKAIIDGGGKSPQQHMIKMARKLESFGAELLVLACNKGSCRSSRMSRRARAARPFEKVLKKSWQISLRRVPK